MKSNLKTPELRFPEFKNAREWEEKTLGEVCELNYGKSPNDILDGKGKYLVYGTSAYDVRRGNKFLFDGETIIVGRKGTISEPYIVRGKIWVIDTAFFSIINTSIININILHCFLQKINLQKYNESSGVPSLSRENLYKIKISIPILPEQEKIASCLCSLDEKIEAEACKLELLKKYKKALMQKLFPKENEKTPELRFPEFKNAGEWEEKTLGEVLQEGSKNRVNDTSEYKKITIKLAFKGIEFFESKRYMADKRPFYIREKNEIIVGKQNYFNGSIALITDEFHGSICSNAIMSFKVIDNNNHFFVLKNISRIDYIKKYSALANGTGQKELSEKDFLSFLALIPSLPEQEKIASCLCSLDEKIEAHTKKIELLKRYKKGLMQKLFPKPNEA